jgi:GNAT superfamily N-acetyltransferase
MQEQILTLEPAQVWNWPVCAAMMRDGRLFQREQGFVQWTRDYPNARTVWGDILRSKGYVLKVSGTVAAYLCLDFDGEPAYERIQGAWHTQPPYAVVHRLAFRRAFRGRGLSNALFELIGACCRERDVSGIRIDTDSANTRMQHVLEKNGFERCGVIVFQGSEKLAYDKILNGCV